MAIKPLQAATRGRLRYNTTNGVLVLALSGLLSFGDVPPVPSFVPGGDEHYYRPNDTLSTDARIARDLRIKKEDDEILAIFTAIWR